MGCVPWHGEWLGGRRIVGNRGKKNCPLLCLVLFQGKADRFGRRGCSGKQENLCKKKIECLGFLDLLWHDEILQDL